MDGTIAAASRCRSTHVPACRIWSIPLRSRC